MAVKVRVPTPWRRFTAGVDEVTAEGDSIKAVLEILEHGLDRITLSGNFIDPGRKAAPRGRDSHLNSHDAESNLLRKSQLRTSMLMPWTAHWQGHAAPASARRVPPSRS